MQRQFVMIGSGPRYDVCFETKLAAVTFQNTHSIWDAISSVLRGSIVIFGSEDL